MLSGRSVPEISEYVNGLYPFLDDNSNKLLPKLSKIQINFITFCMTAMILLGNFCWAKMQRASFGVYHAKSLGWMLHHSSIPWNYLWHASIKKMIEIAGTKGFLICDDSDRLRCKTAQILFGVHKVKDKKTGGFAMAQNLVILIYVTKYICVPVGFKFFRPDPSWQKWKEKDEKLRNQGVKKSDRPKKPDRNPLYPMRTTIAAKLVEEFKTLCSQVNITAVIADAAYFTNDLNKAITKLYPEALFISQIRKNSLVSDRRNKSKEDSKQVEQYFSNKQATKASISLRGMPNKNIEMVSARIYVHSVGRKIHIIALKYEGEEEYRFLATTKLSWRAIDIVRIYSFRWLIEVAIEDWKAYDGWGKSAYQQGEDGACRGVILSFVVDHFLSSHPFQIKQMASKKPLWTSGSLCRYFQSRAILLEIEAILKDKNPAVKLKTMYDNLINIVDFRYSDKHMSGHDIGEFEESISLRKRYKKAC